MRFVYMFVYLFIHATLIKDSVYALGVVLTLCFLGIGGIADYIQKPRGEL